MKQALALGIALFVCGGIADAQPRTNSKTATRKPPTFCGFGDSRELTCSDPRVHDLTPLARFRQLVRLKLRDTPVVDLTPLSGLTGLHDLVLDRTKVTSLSPLRQVPLTHLVVKESPLAQLPSEDALRALKSLTLELTAVRSLAPLRGAQNLERLWLVDTPIRDLTPLHGLKNLAVVFIAGTKLSASQIAALRKATGASIYYRAEPLGRTLRLCSALVSIRSRAFRCDKVFDDEHELHRLAILRKPFSLELSYTSTRFSQLLHFKSLVSLKMTAKAAPDPDHEGLIAPSRVDLKNLRNLQALTRLEIFGLAKRLDQLSRLTALRTLTIGFLASEKGGLSGLSSSHALRTLTVASDLEGWALRPLAGLVGLTSLTLVRSAIPDKNKDEDAEPDDKKPKPRPLQPLRLEPLARLGKLVRLSIRGHEVGDLRALRGLTALKVLELRLNGTDLAELKQLTGLRHLSLTLPSNAPLLALSKLTGLRGLELETTAFSSLKPLSTLVALQRLSLSASAGPVDLEALYPLVGLKTLDLSKLPLVTAKQLAALKRALPHTRITAPAIAPKTAEKLGFCDTFHPADAETIVCELEQGQDDSPPDFKNLARFPRLRSLELKKTDGAYRVDFSKMSWKNRLFELLVDVASIEVSGLTALSNLRTLVLGTDDPSSDTQNVLKGLSVLNRLKKLRRLRTAGGPFGITTLAPLANHPALRHVELNRLDGGEKSKRITLDLSPLGRMTKLKTLVVSGANLKGLTAVANLRRLQKLDLSNTNLTDPRPLGSLTQLQHLRLGGTTLENLVPLERLTNLRTLQLGTIKSGAIGALTGFTKLKKLSILDTDLGDLRPLAKLGQLRQLTISVASGTDLKPLNHLAALERLKVLRKAGGTLRLRGSKSLTTLDLRDAAISELQLANLPALRLLKLPAGLKKLTLGRGLDGLVRVEWRKAELGDLSALAKLPSLRELDLKGSTWKFASLAIRFRSLRKLDLTQAEGDPSALLWLPRKTVVLLDVESAEHPRILRLLRPDLVVKRPWGDTYESD